MPRREPRYSCTLIVTRRDKEFIRARRLLDARDDFGATTEALDFIVTMLQAEKQRICRSKGLNMKVVFAQGKRQINFPKMHWGTFERFLVCLFTSRL